MASISSLIGPALVDHYTMSVQPGKIGMAVSFFTSLGHWHENKERRVAGYWGIARFVEPNDPTVKQCIQLTEPENNHMHIPMDSVHHIALAVHNPELAAREVVTVWNSTESPHKSTMEELPGGKYWVEIPMIFATPIEFTPGT